MRREVPNDVCFLLVWLLIRRSLAGSYQIDQRLPLVFRWHWCEHGVYAIGRLLALTVGCCEEFYVLEVHVERSNDIHVVRQAVRAMSKVAFHDVKPNWSVIRISVDLLRQILITDVNLFADSR